MAQITVIVPDDQVRFFKKVVTMLGYTYKLVKDPAAPKKKSPKPSVKSQGKAEELAQR